MSSVLGHPTRRATARRRRGGKALRTMNLEVRNELADDVPAIEAVIVAAFLHAPHASFTEQHIVNALRKSGNLSVSLVAIVDGDSCRACRNFSGFDFRWLRGLVRARSDFSCAGTSKPRCRDHSYKRGLARVAKARRIGLRGTRRTRLLQPFRVPRRAGLSSAGGPAGILPGLVVYVRPCRKASSLTTKLSIQAAESSRQRRRL